VTTLGTTGTDVYVSGVMDSTIDFRPGATGGEQTVWGSAGFVTKMTGGGMTYAWHRYLGGMGSIGGTISNVHLAWDGSALYAAAAYTSALWFGTQAGGGYQLYGWTGAPGTLVMKLGSDGAFANSFALQHDSGAITAEAITALPGGGVAVAWTMKATELSVACKVVRRLGTSDALVVRFTSALGTPWAQTFGATGNVEPRGLAARSGFMMLAGVFDGSMRVHDTGTQFTAGGWDGFMLQLSGFASGGPGDLGGIGGIGGIGGVFSP